MVYLAYTGMQNFFLTDEPDFTHFKTVYTRDVPYTSISLEIPFDSPGSTLIATVPQAGMYINNVTMKLVLGKLTANSSDWLYTNPKQNGQMLAYASNGASLFTLTLTGSNAYSNTTTWYSNTGVTVSVSPQNKFTFTTTSQVSYIVFSSISVANFWGFIYDPQTLFGGYVKFNIQNQSTFSSQVTFQESGWLPVAGNNRYVDDVMFKFINNASLFIGDQLVQRFDSTYLKSYEESTTTYKNRPVFKLLEGNTNVVDFNRTYYMKFPFIDIPFYAVTRQDIKIIVETNQFQDTFSFATSLIIDFLNFDKSIKLPYEYVIPVVQTSRFSTQKLDSRGPIKIISTLGDPHFNILFNGEHFGNSDLSNISGFENLLNLPVSSNVISFNNTINMSRIRDQKFDSSNTLVYTQNINFLKISNGISGLMFDYSSTVLNKGYDGNIKI